MPFSNERGDAPDSSAPTTSRSRATEWRRTLLVVTSALLLFETVSGLSALLLPFSVPNQLMVVLHTLAGVAFLVPYTWYQVRHWRMYRDGPMTHVKLTGYISLGTTVLAAVSGILLTVQAVFGTRISYTWDTVHIVATVAVIAAVLPHIFILVLYNRKGKKAEALRVREATARFGWRVAAVTATIFAGIWLAVYAYEPPRLVNEMPADYNYLYGADRPFAPSLARTSTGGAFDARSMGGSESCGSSRCHEQIFDEWAVSAHRYSAMDPAFRVVQKTMGEQNGPESTRYCGGCHDPISLFAGTKNLFQDDLTNPIGYDEGVSCIVCHSIQETDIQGNANYLVTQPARYMFELGSEGPGRYLRDFLIRAYPRQHVTTLQHRLFKSPEFCAACHKQFIDEEINQVGWVQLQNQFDNWRKSRWNHPGDASKTVECRECHMQLAESNDPARGDDLDYNRHLGDGKHRSHRFLASNQFVPTLLDLPGAEEHVALTEQWLRGEIDVPEIADKWRPGPAIPLELIAPPEVSPGEEVIVAAVITNNKVGHDFPTGPLDIIQAWIEISATDQDGNIIFESGSRDERNFIQPGSFILKAEPVDQYGNLIDRHNLWEMVGVRYRRALYPGFSDRAEFTFPVPITTPSRGDEHYIAGEDNGVGSTPATIHVTAKLLYRKFDQFLLNFLFGEDADITSTVTALSEAEAIIVVTEASQ